MTSAEQIYTDSEKIMNEKIQEYNKTEKPVCPKCEKPCKINEARTSREHNAVFTKCEDCGELHVGNFFFKEHVARLDQYKKEQEEQEKKIWKTPQLMRYIFSDLSQRVKHDEVIKSSVVNCGVSAYLHEPLNLFAKGESGSGKTYNTLESLQYFPQEDIWYLAGLSPKAIVHQKGTIMDANGIEIDLDEKPVKPKATYYDNKEDYKNAVKSYKEEKKIWDERIKQSYNYINLDNTILVFLETPHIETMKMLYPILSHDKRRIEYRFVNKSGSGSLRTDKVVIEGYPTAIFLSTDKKHVQELATRSFTVSPESDSNKIKSANTLTNRKNAMPWKYRKKPERFTAIKGLMRAIKTTSERNDSKLDVIIPFLDLEELFSNYASRDMRDFTHFNQFLKSWTLIHIYQRPIIEIEDTKYLISTIYDAMCCYKIFEDLIATTRTGTEKRILDFYENYMLTGQESYHIAELTNAYNEDHEKTKLSDYTIRKWEKRLNKIGFVDELEDSNDKRKKVYKPIVNSAKGFSVEVFENVCDYEKQTILFSKLKKNFKTWLEINCNDIQDYRRFFLEDEESLSLESLAQLVITDEKNTITFLTNLFNDVNNPDLDPKEQSELENARKIERQILSNNSDKNKPKTQSIDELLQPKTNEIPYKGNLETVNLPKKQFTDGER